ncbi:hypothetical protein QQF64_018564 [Cirrhinus molitorella]|uniref:PiggyBac transposable element-derived protein domain-containing protein n=1 Tax=Cirrhinus molitorella TaxID=172907 RepID=A0ABR3LD18_9TELE
MPFACLSVSSCKRLLPANQWLLVDLTDSDTIASDQSEVAQGVSNFRALPGISDPAISDNEGSDEEDDDVADPDFIPPAHNLDTPCSSDMGPSAKRKCVRPVWRSLRMMMTTMRMKTSQHHNTFPPLNYIETPYNYFSRYFSPQVIKHITYQTNLNATQKDINTTFTTTEEEMRNFVAILLYMGISELPSIDDYWVMETRVQVANLMSSKRFRLMRSLVHFNDNTQIPGTTDRQDIKNKPDKWGFKLFARASEDGFIHDLVLYQGKTTLEARGRSVDQHFTNSGSALKFETPWATSDWSDAMCVAICEVD